VSIVHEPRILRQKRQRSVSGEVRISRDNDRDRDIETRVDDEIVNSGETVRN
jgi:hypothetical protein